MTTSARQLLNQKIRDPTSDFKDVFLCLKQITNLNRCKVLLSISVNQMKSILGQQACYICYKLGNQLMI